jgi:TolA-binding protein
VTRGMRVRLTALVLMGAVGCAAHQAATPPSQLPSAASEWPTTYAQAISEARESRLGIADRVLTDFAQRFPDSPEAAEVPYWRAVYKLDPNNASATREAIVLLDSYLANTPNGLHRAEATTLRRVASALEARNAAVAAQTVAPVPKPDEKAHEEELARLRDELARANTELTRIKSRLARPKP